jgi:hypothetical protein
MKEDDGMYKVRLIDRASGGKVNAAFDATTGELIHAKLAHEEANPKKRDQARGQKESRERKEHGEHRDKAPENGG